jgi:hypothetical protein
VAIFGVDLSSYQPDSCVYLATEQGYSFAILKATEGRRTRDSTFAGKLARARARRLPVAAYHFVRMDSTPAEQAANVQSVVPRDVPVWLDIEAGSTKAQGAVIGEALRAAGWRVAGMYVSTKPPAGYGWWRAAYGSDPIGFGSQVYRVNGGDTSKYWAGQDIWQCGQHGRLQGYAGDVDIDVVRDLTLDQLLATGWFLTYDTPEPDPDPEIPPELQPASEDDDVALITGPGSRLYCVGSAGKWYIPDSAISAAISESTGVKVATRVLTQDQLDAIPDAGRQLDPAALAAQLAPLLPDEISEQTVEDAIRHVLGSLDAQ